MVFDLQDRYRPNVAVVLLHPTDAKKVLFCHRVRFDTSSGWQFPQGGVDTNLDFFEEMKRELLEEIGTANVEVVQVSDMYYNYDFPGDPSRFRGGYIGQRQKWVLCRLIGDDSQINVHTETPEFDSWEWTSPQEATKWVVDFKQGIYHGALTEFGLL